jgi:hypothetical protein
MTKPETIALLAFIGCWFALSGGGGCGAPDPGQTASPTVTSYTTPPWVQADGVLWQPSYSVGGAGVTILGDADSYVLYGGVDGPIPPAAVYECSSPGCPAGTSHHCPGGSSSTCGTCPVPCFEYHTSEGWEHKSSARFEYLETCIRDEGDGVSAARVSTSGPWAGEISFRRSRTTATHDDALEHDGCNSIMVTDSLIDGTFMGFAMKPRGDDPQDCTASTIKLDRALVRLNRFTNAYEQKDGHGGVFKLEDGNLPWFIVLDSTFWIGGDSTLKGPGEGQHYLPPPSRIAQPSDCAGNTILFSGDTAQLTAWLADEDGADGLTNAEKLAALSYCYTLVTRQTGQSWADFYNAEWLPRWSAWMNSHAAADGC